MRTGAFYLNANGGVALLLSAIVAVLAIMGAVDVVHWIADRI